MGVARISWWGCTPPLPSPSSLPFPTLPFPLPPLPYSPVPFHYSSVPTPPFPTPRSKSLESSYGAGESCKLPQLGLGRIPSRNRIWCISGFPRVLKSPEFRVFKMQDLKSPEIGQWSWKSHQKVLNAILALKYNICWQYFKWYSWESAYTIKFVNFTLGAPFQKI